MISNLLSLKYSFAYGSLLLLESLSCLVRRLDQPCPTPFTSPCLTQLNSRGQLGLTEGVVHFVKFFQLTDLPEESVKMGWSCSSAWITCLRRFRCSFIASIEDLLFSDQTTVCNFEYRLVEWLILVVAVSVCCSHLIGMLVLLSPPAVTVPQLPIAFISRGKSVRAHLHL